MKEEVENKNNKSKLWIIIICILIITSIAFLVKDIKSNNEIDVVNEIENATENLITENKIDENLTDESTEQDSSKSSNEIFSEYYKKAEEKLNEMTLEEKVGQMFLARYPTQEEALKEIEEEHPGGYVLFAKDFEGETQKSVISKLSEAQGKSKIPLIFAVDEEGGNVTRVSRYSAFRASKFKSPQQLYKSGGIEAIIAENKEKSQLLLSLGINMNLAPVADVSTNMEDFIYERTFGKNAESTAEYIKQIIISMNEEGIISTMKHFPGYGNNADTHLGVAIDERDYQTFETSDFLPFISGIEAKAPAILVSHNIVKCMDENNPASLSENVHKILREDLNFSGIIMTDDLGMESVKSYVESGEAAILAVKAGNDIIMTSDFKTQKNQVVEAVKQGEISEDIINTAVKRILALKYAYKIIE